MQSSFRQPLVLLLIFICAFPVIRSFEAEEVCHENSTCDWKVVDSTVQLCKDFEDLPDYQPRAPRAYVDASKWKDICTRAQEKFTYSDYWARFLHHSNEILLLFGTQIVEFLLQKALNNPDIAKTWAPTLFSSFFRFLFWLLLIFYGRFSPDPKPEIPKVSTGSIVFNKPMMQCTRQRCLNMQEPLNQGWILYNDDLLALEDKKNDDFASYPKLFIMGRYKVGKTQLAKWLGMTSASPSNTINTRGELFYFPKSPDWKGWVIVDSEGFDQPIDTSEPELKKIFITEHAKVFADVIVLVIPHLLTTDLYIYLDYVNGFVRDESKRKLIVVHNLQKFRSEQEITCYKNMFADNVQVYPGFHGKAHMHAGNLHIGHYTDNQQRKEGEPVYHFFLGDNDVEEVRRHNLLQLDKIKEIITQPGPRNNEGLRRSLYNTLEKTGTRFYNFEDSLEKPSVIKRYTTVQVNGTDVQAIVYKFHPRIVSQNMQYIENRQYFGLDLLYEWQDVVQRNDPTNGDTYYLPLVFRMSRIHEIYISISEIDTQQNSIMVPFDQISFSFPIHANVSVTDDANFKIVPGAPVKIKIPLGFQVIKRAILQEHKYRLDKSSMQVFLIPVELA